MKSYSTVVIILVMTMSFFVIPTSSALAGEQISTQSMIREKEQVDEPTKLRLRLKSQLCKETGLTEEAVDKLEPLLEEALQLNGGETEPIRKMVRKAVQIDCVGECLMERLRAQNMLMLQEQKQVVDGEKQQDQKRLTARTRTRDKDQSGDLKRTENRSQMRSQSGSGSGDGSGAGQ